jgi:hypothetical protein
MNVFRRRISPNQGGTSVAKWIPAMSPESGVQGGIEYVKGPAIPMGLSISLISAIMVQRRSSFTDIHIVEKYRCSRGKEADYFFLKICRNGFLPYFCTPKIKGSASEPVISDLLVCRVQLFKGKIP